MSAADHPRVHPRNLAAWRRWLRDSHATAKGVWLVGYNAASGKPRLGYEESIPEALAYGWIDSVAKPLDAERTMLLFTPRRVGSGWSGRNKERIARLMKEERMQPAGLAKIAAAKRDGSWALLDGVDALTPGARKVHLRALVAAKRPETRARRVAEIARTVRP